MPRHERIRLLWLIDSLTVGGAESLVVPFVRRLDRERYELYVCCLATINDNAIEKELRKESVPLMNLGARNLRDLGAFRALLRYVREQKIDLIHAHLTYAAIWAAVVSRQTKVPSLATLHVAPPEGGKEGLRDGLMRWLVNRYGKRVVAVSEALRRRYLAKNGIDPKKFVAVHNGIEIDRFRREHAEARAQLARELGIEHDTPVVMTVSVLRPGKGIEVLLDAVSSVPGATFVIVGDGPMRAEWTARAERNGVGNRVRWAGYRNDVAALLPGADLFVLPSLDDAFPTVLLEAMAAGLPVVATEVGGIPEIVTRDTGRLVPPNDAVSLANAINTTLGDVPGRLAMSDAARRDAAQKFSTDAWIARLDHLYRTVLGEEGT